MYVCMYVCVHVWTNVAQTKRRLRINLIQPNVCSLHSLFFQKKNHATDRKVQMKSERNASDLDFNDLPQPFSFIGLQKSMCLPLAPMQLSTRWEIHETSILLVAEIRQFVCCRSGIVVSNPDDGIRLFCCLAGTTACRTDSDYLWSRKFMHSPECD